MDMSGILDQNGEGEWLEAVDPASGKVFILDSFLLKSEHVPGLCRLDDLEKECRFSQIGVVLLCSEGQEKSAWLLLVTMCHAHGWKRWGLECLLMDLQLASANEALDLGMARTSRTDVKA